eukprot:5796560-Amphidinium_carterae.2
MPVPGLISALQACCMTALTIGKHTRGKTDQRHPSKDTSSSARESEFDERPPHKAKAGQTADATADAVLNEVAGQVRAIILLSWQLACCADALILRFELEVTVTQIALSKVSRSARHRGPLAKYFVFEANYKSQHTCPHNLLLDSCLPCLMQNRNWTRFAKAILLHHGDRAQLLTGRAAAAPHWECRQCVSASTAQAGLSMRLKLSSVRLVWFTRELPPMECAADFDDCPRKPSVKASFATTRQQVQNPLLYLCILLSRPTAFRHLGQGNQRQNQQALARQGMAPWHFFEHTQLHCFAVHFGSWFSSLECCCLLEARPQPKGTAGYSGKAPSKSVGKAPPPGIEPPPAKAPKAAQGT